MIRKIIAAAAAVLACSGAMAATTTTPETFTFDFLTAGQTPVSFSGSLAGGFTSLGFDSDGNSLGGYQTYITNVKLDGGIVGFTSKDPIAKGPSTFYDNLYTFSVAGPVTHHQITFDALYRAGGTANLNYSFNWVSAATPVPNAISNNAPLSPAPEPETYAMMLAGLGALGFMGRRRKSNGA